MVHLRILLIASLSFASQATADDKGCTRGEPAQVFSSTAPSVSTVSFKRSSSVEATEDVHFRSGDRLLLGHGGCESYAISFRYESRDIRPRDDPAFWFATSAKILDGLVSAKP